VSEVHTKSENCGEKAKNVANAIFIDFNFPFFFFPGFFSRPYYLQS
jgi:hypothetical protein